MTVSDINRYISVASKWERKYSDVAQENESLSDDIRVMIGEIQSLHQSRILQIEIINKQKEYIDVLEKKYKFVIKCLFASHVLLIFSGLHGLGII